jgi:hypothetical protein
MSVDTNTSDLSATAIDTIVAHPNFESELRVITDERSTRVGRRPSVVALAAAALLAGAGVVHLVMVPSHADASIVEAVGFAVAGWIQLLLAAALVVRARPAVWITIVVSSVAAIGIWAISRTVGLPVGAHENEAVSAALVDVSVVGMQAVAALLALGALRPRRSVSHVVRPASIGAMIAVPTLVMGFTSAVLASPSARGHGEVHDAAVGTAHGHGDGEVAAATGDPSAAAAVPGDTGNQDGSHDATHDAGAHGADHGATDPDADVAAAPVDDGGFSLVMNGHQHPPSDAPLTVDQTVTLTQQLAATQELIVKYPTVADAELGGYARYGPFGPAVGAHYGKGADTVVGPVIDDTNAGKPMLIFDGTEPTSRLAGFMYIVPGAGEVPEGFAGEKDVWHSHSNICLVSYPDGRVDAPFGADAENIDPAICADVGGFILEDSGYMLHVWNVPGYENPLGMFYATHPALTCADGSYLMRPMEEIGFSESACVDAA